MVKHECGVRGKGLGWSYTLRVVSIQMVGDLQGVRGQRRGQVQGLLPGALQSEQAKMSQHKKLTRRSQ